MEEGEEEEAEEEEEERAKGKWGFGDAKEMGEVTSIVPRSIGGIR